MCLKMRLWMNVSDIIIRCSCIFYLIDVLEEGNQSQAVGSDNSEIIPVINLHKRFQIKKLEKLEDEEFEEILMNHFDMSYLENMHATFEIAEKEMKMLKHPYVGTEHLLLGLIEEGTGVAYTVLTDNKITSDEYREKIETSTGIGSKTVLTPEDLTPRTKRVMQMAMVISSRMGNSYVGTEHLLLALLSESDSYAVKFLVELDVNIQTLAEELQKNIRLCTFPLLRFIIFGKERARETISFL